MALALYRKYRPRTFTEVIGQEHVTEPLIQALSSGRLNHAYLFSGPRGCGKTSSARILARSLNCDTGPTPNPCGECESCRALAPDGPGSIDVIEIDAASHGGVDDARELRERAFFAPAASRYKIYIIDEAHMVSSAGFNALLKLVEEPPDYVKFVFATTEPEKVLGTIKSRTHHYPFRLIPPGVLRPYLEQLASSEGVKVDPQVFPLVVRAGGGSARDTLSVLDQLIAGSGPEGVTYARAVALLGVTDAALIDEMVDALAAGDGGGAFAAVDQVAEAGHDARRFAGDLLQRFRDLIILRRLPEAVERGVLDAPEDELARMRDQAGRLGDATLSRFADILHNGLVEMRGATSPRLLLELFVARMLLPAADDSASAVLQRLERLERGAPRPSSHPGDSAPTASSIPDDAAPAAPLEPGLSPQAAARRIAAQAATATRPAAGASPPLATPAQPDPPPTAAADIAPTSGAQPSPGAEPAPAGTPLAGNPSSTGTQPFPAGASPADARASGVTTPPAGARSSGADTPATGAPPSADAWASGAGTPPTGGPPSGGAQPSPAGASPGGPRASASASGRGGRGSRDSGTVPSQPAGRAPADRRPAAQPAPAQAEEEPWPELATAPRSAQPAESDPDSSGQTQHGAATRASGAHLALSAAQPSQSAAATPAAQPPQPASTASQPTAATAPQPTAAVAPGAPASQHAQPVAASASQHATGAPASGHPSSSAASQSATAAPASGPPAPAAPSSGVDAQSVRRSWEEIVRTVGRSSKKAAAFAREAVVRDVEGDTLILVFKHKIHADGVTNEPGPVQEAVYQVIGQRWRVRCEIGGDGRPAPTAPQRGSGASGPDSRQAPPRAATASRPRAPIHDEPPPSDDDIPPDPEFEGRGYEGFDPGDEPDPDTDSLAVKQTSEQQALESLRQSFNLEKIAEDGR